MRSPSDRPVAVPTSRGARLLRAGGLTAGVLGGALATGARLLAQGQRPNAAQLVLTPRTAQRLTRDLGAMRGAAMKLGQMLSMDAGTVLPPEMTAILAQLRAAAPAMPPAQLRDVLDSAWGPGWYGRFARFDVRPFAAASIGQVHRAQTRDGQDLAIKVQYPGVRASIDSDLANAAALLRLPGLIPRGMDLAPVLEAVRTQLHQEADYRQEATNLRAYAKAVGQNADFAIPLVIDALSGENVLAMGYLPGAPLETLDAASQHLRDRIAGALISLTLDELFTHHLMQSDPNPGNYRFDEKTGRLVLLDFGAVVPIDPAIAADYRVLLRTILADDRAGAVHIMERIGYLSPGMDAPQRSVVEHLFWQAAKPLQAHQSHDFATDPLPKRLADQGVALARGRSVTHVPPPHTVFLHRKIAGIYLIAQSLRARIALRPLLERHV